MTTILLAIEDPKRLRHLKSMISWLDHGYQIVGEGGRMQETQELAGRLCPDILLLSSGLFGEKYEQVELLRKSNGQTGLILFSEDRDFSKLQDAMTLGVDGYLVWSELTEQALLTTVERCVSRVQTYVKVESIIKREFLRKIIVENTVLRQSHEALNCFSFDSNFSFVFFIIEHSLPLPLTRELRDLTAEPVLTDEFFESLTAPEDCLFLCSLYLSNHTCGALYQFVHHVSQRRQTEFLFQCAGEICRDAKERFGQTVSIVGIEPFSRIESLHRLYHARQPLLQLSCYGWRGKLISPLKPVRFQKRSYGYLDGQLERFRSALEEQNLPELRAILQDLFFYTETVLIPLEEIRYICAGLMACAQKLLPREFFSRECAALYENRANSEVTQNIRSLQNWFALLCEGGCRELALSQAGKHTGKLRKILLYISRHYTEDLSVDQVAAAFSLSSDYFRHYFKKEVGSTFVDYLTAYRIEMSKKLLRGGGCRINEVAAQVGFHSSQYYSMVFHKYVSLSPSQYMRKYGELQDKLHPLG